MIETSTYELNFVSNTSGLLKINIPRAQRNMQESVVRSGMENIILSGVVLHKGMRPVSIDSATLINTILEAKA
jgi:hypothetical protein